MHARPGCSRRPCSRPSCSRSPARPPATQVPTTAGAACAAPRRSPPHPCPSDTSIALPTSSPARIEAARERRFDGLRAEANRAARADRLAHRPAGRRALPPEPAEAALPGPAALELRGRREHRPTSTRRPRSRSTGSATTRIRRARHARGGVDRQGDRRPDPVSGLHPPCRLVRGPALREPAAGAARLARRARAHARLEAQLHARQPRPVRRPRPRPPDCLPAVRRSGRAAGARSPETASRPRCAAVSRRGSGSSTPPPTSSSPSARSIRCSPCSVPTRSSQSCATGCAPRRRGS